MMITSRHLCKMQICRKMLAAVVAAVTLLSCGSGGREARDVIETVQIVSIDDLLPPLHNGALLAMAGDTLLIVDTKSTDMMVTAFDLSGDSVVGRFAPFGNGLGEVCNIGQPIVTPGSRHLFLIDYGSWSVKRYDIDSALNCPDYMAVTVDQLDDNSQGFPDRCVALTDSIVVGRLIIPSPEGRGYTQGLCNYNLYSGEMGVFDGGELLPGFKSIAVASVDDNLVVELGSNRDAIRMYSFDGKLIKTIFGPEYHEDKLTRHTTFFSKAIVARGKIYAVYSGGGEEYHGSDIVEMTLGGDYLRTLHTDLPIISLAYHEKSDRIYISTSGETQFGYLIPDRAMPSIVEADDTNAGNEASEGSGMSEKILVTIDKRSPVAVDTAEAIGTKSEDGSYEYLVPIGNFTSDTLWVDSVVASYPYPERLQMSCDPIYPRSVSGIRMAFDRAVESEGYDVTVYLRDIASPQRLKTKLRVYQANQ